MSLVLVQVGQCGNQIGSQLLHTVMEDTVSCNKGDAKWMSSLERSYCDDSHSRFFNTSPDGRYSARAVLVDTEMKVIEEVTEANNSSLWSYNKRNIYWQKRGSGNNWADGYCRHGPVCVPPVLDLIRKEIEKCDRLDGLLICMSLAGGTGSGLGTRIVENLNDELPEAMKLGVAVWPHTRGEISTQNYNSLLSLSHLAAPHNGMDGVVMLENDLLQNTCARRLGLSRVGMKHLNEIIAHHLANLLQPVQQEQSSLSHLLASLCCHPDFKLLQVKSIPYASREHLQFSTDTWPQLMKHLRQMLITDAHMDEGIDWSVKETQRRSAYLSSVVITRGVGSSTVDVAGLASRQLYCDWLLRGDKSHTPLIHWTHERPFAGYAKSCALAVNGQCSIGGVEGVLQKAWRMFNSKAFVHQYTEHGFGEEDFLDCFAATEQLLHNYRYNINTSCSR